METIRKILYSKIFPKFFRSEISYSKGPYSLEELVEKLMEAAKETARSAEVPIASMVCEQNTQGKYHIIGTGFNRVCGKEDPTAHGEMLALRSASRKKKTERLEDCILLTTLEPCLMCSGAVILARLKSVYYLTASHKGPGLAWLLEEAQKKRIQINHQPCLFHLKEKELEYQKLLCGFFQERR